MQIKLDSFMKSWDLGVHYKKDCSSPSIFFLLPQNETVPYPMTPPLVLPFLGTPGSSHNPKTFIDYSK